MARREVKFSYISTYEMMADTFTKPVPGNKLQICCKGTGVEGNVGCGLKRLRASVKENSLIKPP